DTQLDEIAGLLDRAVQDTRSLTFDLSPPILYELGLGPALEWLVERVQEEHGIRAVFEDDGKHKPLGDDARAFLFRAVRELLMNVARHAHARTVTVAVSRSNDSIRVEVTDDGVGFHVSEREWKTRGFGLFSIRERMTDLGGDVDVQSEPEKGTRVTLTVPLESA
ncbi:MAG: sensor histidine kinase, partial [Chloroflexota bacterium]|nr:sensor histidine kinase [Chloroflexota bacterium]